MLNYLKFIAVGVVTLSATARAEITIPQQQPYPLPADVQQSLKSLASECDVLVIGETHGTKEMPAIVAGETGHISSPNDLSLTFAL